MSLTKRQMEAEAVKLQDCLNNDSTSCFRGGFKVGRRLALAGVFAHYAEAYKAFSDTESYYNDPAANNTTRYCKGFRLGFDYVDSGMEAALGKLDNKADQQD